jgi:hypothetical protein
MLRRISCRTLNLKWTCVLEPIALLQNTINLNSSFLLQKLIYFTLVYWVSLRQSWAQSVCIVVSYKLLSCARNSIMMDTDTQLLELIVFSGKYLLNFLLIDVFSDDLLRKHFALCFHQRRILMHLLLGSWSWGEVARPEVIMILPIWECVRVSNRPLDILLFDSFHILTWSGHLQLNVCFVILVDVINYTFYLRKFLLSVLVCKITPHWDQYILT